MKIEVSTKLAGVHIGCLINFVDVLATSFAIENLESENEKEAKILQLSIFLKV